ncbi:MULTISPECIES: FAD-binding oxidoreductase [Amycolatopsis methanolica group]|uniref:FAD linked oxidase domain protein n=1 Tax=Amycolatopsis methanolica 239 TaxID=1068978 RepID=A0A076N460_AMYME|nr:FAD linked oxidase domain protein [Amycolatopsis methanolica 239]
MSESELLIRQLTAAVGAGKVLTDPAVLSATSHDTWPVSTKWARQDQHPYRGDVVIRAGSEADVVAVLEVAEETGVPVTTRGLGSSVTGQPLPTRGGIVLDLSGLTGPHEVDEVDMTVTAPAGMNGGALEDALNQAGWTMRFSPQSLYRSSVGGWLATLATGQFSSRYGGVEDLVVGYRVVLAGGEVAELTASPRAAMGPDLRRVFLGSEGTLGVITRVTLKIVPLPAAQHLQTFLVPDVTTGLAIMREQAARGLRPSLLRLYDADEARHAMADPDFDGTVLFVGTEGEPEVAAAEMTVLTTMATERGATELGPEPVQAWLDRRFDFSTVEKRLDTPGGFAETIEVAHTWRHIEGLYAAIRKALEPLADEVLVHFSHVYPQGTSMYVILLGQVADDAAASARLAEIWATTMQIGLDHGAELSHHHGGGLARSPYSRRSLGAAHGVLRRLKHALDPDGLLNPGKLGL